MTLNEYGIFEELISDNCRPEAATDAMSGVALQEVSLNDRAKFSDMGQIVLGLCVPFTS